MVCVRGFVHGALFFCALRRLDPPYIYIEPVLHIVNRRNMFLGDLRAGRFSNPDGKISELSETTKERSKADAPMKKKKGIFFTQLSVRCLCWQCYNDKSSVSYTSDGTGTRNSPFDFHSVGAWSDIWTVECKRIKVAISQRQKRCSS
jgi:hypothetical protein